MTTPDLTPQQRVNIQALLDDVREFLLEEQARNGQEEQKQSESRVTDKPKKAVPR